MNRSRLAGLGQLPTLPPFPQPGDLEGQLAFGAAIHTIAITAASSIVGGNPDVQAMASLKAIGIPMTTTNITTASNLGVIARDVTTVVGAVASVGAAAAATVAGGSCAGPWGAAAGAIVAAIEVVVSLFIGGPSELVGYNGNGAVSPGAQVLYNLVHQWGAMSLNMGAVSGNPVGWSFYDYISRKYPPSGTGQSMKGNLWNEVVSNLWSAGSSPGDPNVGSLKISYGGSLMSQGSFSGPNAWAESYFKYNYGIWGPCEGGSGENFQGSCHPWQGNVGGSGGSMSDEDAYLKLCQPLATPVFWLWYGTQSKPAGQAITGVANNCFFQNDGRTIADRYNVWTQDTSPIVTSSGSLSVQQILQYAEANRPSPAFYAADLYVAQTNANSAGSPNQLYGNCATMSGVATVCGLLAAGGDCLSVASELMIQQYVLQTLNGSVPSLFKLLVDEYVTKAQAEMAGASAVAVSTPFSWGTAALVAAAMGVTGLLGYSAYTKQSPITVLRSAGSAIRSQI
jgi:hypothetical protein